MEKSITCLIIDDEPLARSLLERFVSRVPLLSLVGSCNNVVGAMQHLGRERPNLLFLDVEMPDLSGFNLLDMMVINRPQIVLTTAYPQYAINGFDYDVTDYLLKPIQFDRFLRSVHKVHDQLTSIFENNSPHLEAEDTAPFINNSDNNLIWITTNKTRLQIDSHDILYIESFKDYLKIHLYNKTIVVRMALYKIEQLLPANCFIRTHRSYLVRRNAISAACGTTIKLINDKQLPIGVYY